MLTCWMVRYLQQIWKDLTDEHRKDQVQMTMVWRALASATFAHAALGLTGKTCALVALRPTLIFFSPLQCRCLFCMDVPMPYKGRSGSEYGAKPLRCVSCSMGAGRGHDPDASD